ncbi:MFS transporter [Brachybacterium hainanense]|uniref:MFS transporter n=1 Tax=Brachybacterium hainanense TaxID=1541174 RepID=A0ABV6RCY1_9MICO
MPTPPAPPASAPREAAERAPLQRRTLIVLAVTQVIGTIGVGVAPSIGILLASEVTASETWAGLARTASTLGAALAGLPLGMLAGRFGRRFALSSGWWTAALGAGILVIAAQASLVVPLFLGLLLIGVGSAVSLQARFAATDLADPRHRGRALALIVWVGTLGSVLGPNLGLPGGAVGAAVGLSVYAAAFLIAAVALFLAGTLVFLLLRPDPLQVLAADAPAAAPPVPGAARPARGERLRLLVSELRERPRVRYAVLAILTAQAVMASIMTMTPVHIVHEGGSVNLVGVTISLHVAGMFAFAPLVGMLADRFGPRAIIGAGVGILLISLGVGAALSTSTAGVILALILLGLGWSFVNVSASALFTAAVPDAVRASSQGAVDASANLVAAVAAFAAGPLLAVSSFPVLSIIAILALAPLAAATLRHGTAGAGRG